MNICGPNDGDDGQPHSTATSRSLLGRVRDDDGSAWRQLVDLYAPLVFEWCRRAGLQHQDVADILQDVFQAVVVHIGGFRKEQQRDTFRGWLRRITQNKLRDHFRRRERDGCGAGGSSAIERMAQFPAPMPLDDELLDAVGKRNLFARGLNRIRNEFENRTWSAFWQTVVVGRLAQDVAADLSMTPGAVRVAKSRVLHRLREELGDLDE